jgi:hypothetical protein
MRTLRSRLKLTVNENKAGLSTAGREVRLSRVHVWSMLLAETGRAYLGYHSVQETSTAHL